MAEASGLEMIEELLSLGQWREADGATTEYLLRVGDHTGLPGLNRREVRALQVEPLRAVEAAWSSATDGHFGFESQLELVVQLNRELALQGSRLWHAFGERVGWVRRRTWLDHDELSFERDAPTGHLPWVPGLASPVATGRLFDRLELFYERVGHALNE